MPPVEIETVIAFTTRPGTRAEKVEVRGATAAVVVVVSRRWVNDIHDSLIAPRWLEAAREVVVHPLVAGRVSVVAECQHDGLRSSGAVGAEKAVRELASCLVATGSTHCDVANGNRDWFSLDHQFLL